MTRHTEICHINDIPENSAKGMTVESVEGEREIFIVRTEKGIFGYENSCPHTGVNLEWQPDQFLDADLNYIQCSTHGAKFQIDDGLCIFGPCVGQSLKPVNLVRDKDIIKIQECKE